MALPGTHRDAIKQHLALALNQRRHIVVVARRGATARNDKIALSRGAMHQLGNRLLIIGCNAIEHGSAPASSASAINADELESRI